MGIVVGINADLSKKAIGYNLPVKDGAQYFNFFNGEENITRNLVPGKPLATKVGSPVVNAQSLTLTNQSAYINTNVAQTEEMTIFTLGEITAAAGNFVHWSNYGSPITNFGSGLTSQTCLKQAFANSVNTLALSYSADGTTRGLISYGEPAGDPTVKLRLMVSRFSQAAMATKIADLTRGTQNVSVIAAGGIIAKAGTILLGSHNSAFEASTGKIYMCAIYNRALTDTEIATVGAAIKNFYIPQGFPV